MYSNYFTVHSQKEEKQYIHGKSYKCPEEDGSNVLILKGCGGLERT